MLLVRGPALSSKAVANLKFPSIRKLVPFRVTAGNSWGRDRQLLMGLG